MINISLCMIVKNGSEVICRCMDSVKGIVDEIIIADTGSTDNTKAIVSQHIGKISNFEWIDGFVATRNSAFSHASMGCILRHDADDVLLEPERQKLFQLKQNLESPANNEIYGTETQLFPISSAV